MEIKVIEMLFFHHSVRFSYDKRCKKIYCQGSDESDFRWK
jgi:hypothetical protein